MSKSWLIIKETKAADFEMLSIAADKSTSVADKSTIAADKSTIGIYLL